MANVYDLMEKERTEEKEKKVGGAKLSKKPDGLEVPSASTPSLQGTLWDAAINRPGHPAGCDCGLHNMPSLFEMAELRKKIKQDANP